MPTYPTLFQAEYISNGEESLPFTFENQTKCQVIQRGQVGNQFPQVVNQLVVGVEALRGVAMMRVCKQALSECREVLYGENFFSFTTYPSPDELKHFPQWVPGMLNKNGSPQTPQQVELSIDRMFAPGSFLPKFVAKDEMLRFFHRIGRINTSLLTKIKIAGQMRTHRAGENLENTSPGFKLTLDIHTTILNKTCPSLKDLTLHMMDYSMDSSENSLCWDDDLQRAKSNDAHLNEIVEKVATRLRTLKVFQLGGPKSLNSTPFKENWGTSVKWMTFVKERAHRQQLEDAKKSQEVKDMEAKAHNEILANIAQSSLRDVQNEQRFAPRFSREGGRRGGYRRY